MTEIFPIYLGGQRYVQFRMQDLGLRTSDRFHKDDPENVAAHRQGNSRIKDLGPRT